MVRGIWTIFDYRLLIDLRYILHVKIVAFDLEEDLRASYIPLINTTTAVLFQLFDRILRAQLNLLFFDLWLRWLRLLEQDYLVDEVILYPVHIDFILHHGRDCEQPRVIIVYSARWCTIQRYSIVFEDRASRVVRLEVE